MSRGVHADDLARDCVLIYRCWGCNRLKIPRPWTPATLPLLRSERRLVEREYLCGHSDCAATTIARRKP